MRRSFETAQSEHTEALSNPLPCAFFARGLGRGRVGKAFSYAAIEKYTYQVFGFAGALLIS